MTGHADESFRPRPPARPRHTRRREALAQRRSVQITAEDFDVRPVQHFPGEAVEAHTEAAADEGAESMTLATMAGHDSVVMNRITPSVMLFVPSVDGVSHCEREFTSDADLVTGLRVLTAAVRRLVDGEVAAARKSSAQDPTTGRTAVTTHSIDHLTPIQKTLLITLKGRARDNTAKTSFLRDELAAELVNRLDYDLDTVKLGAGVQEGIAIRTRMLDRAVDTFVRAHPDAVVVELGSALVRRMFRLDPPGTVV